MEKLRTTLQDRYGPAVVRALKAIWEAAGYPWSARLKALVPLWLPWARKRLWLAPATEAGLRASKTQRRRRLDGRTKPGTLLTDRIPLKTDHWDVHAPGFTEVDLVSHIEQKNWTARRSNAAPGGTRPSTRSPRSRFTWTYTRVLI